MSPITTHILDVSLGRPAQQVTVELEAKQKGGWASLSKKASDADGRIKDFLAPGALKAGTYRLRFSTGDYFKRREVPSFYPFVEVVFDVADAEQHHHVPLLLSPYGYSTYRGS